MPLLDARAVSIGIRTLRRAATSIVRLTGNGMPPVTVACPSLTQRVNQVAATRVLAGAGVCLTIKDAPQVVLQFVRRISGTIRHRRSALGITSRQHVRIMGITPAVVAHPVITPSVRADVIMATTVVRILAIRQRRQHVWIMDSIRKAPRHVIIPHVRTDAVSTPRDVRPRVTRRLSAHQMNLRQQIPIRHILQVAHHRATTPSVRAAVIMTVKAVHQVVTQVVADRVEVRLA